MRCSINDSPVENMYVFCFVLHMVMVLRVLVIRKTVYIEYQAMEFAFNRLHGLMTPTE